MHTDHFAQAVTTSAAPSGWGPWTQDVPEPADGSGPLLQPMFWLGGGTSLLLWGCVTWLALSFT